MFAKSDYATYRWVGGDYANDVDQSKNITSWSSLGPASFSCETSEMKAAAAAIKKKIKFQHPEVIVFLVQRLYN